MNTIPGEESNSPENNSKKNVLSIKYFVVALKQSHLTKPQCVETCHVKMKFRENQLSSSKDPLQEMLQEIKRVMEQKGSFLQMNLMSI